MYYVVQGKTVTLRALFSSMPPQEHHPDHTQSKVVAHIMQTLGCDLEQAIRSFNSMRNPRSKVITFDRVHGVWHGCEWLPDGEKDTDLVLNRKLTDLQKKLERDKSDSRKVNRESRRLNEELAGLREELEHLKQVLGQQAPKSNFDVEAGVRGHEMQISGIFTRLTRLEEGLVALREEIYGSLDAMEGRIKGTGPAPSWHT